MPHGEDMGRCSLRNGDGPGRVLWVRVWRNPGGLGECGEMARVDRLDISTMWGCGMKTGRGQVTDVAGGTEEAGNESGW